MLHKLHGKVLIAAALVVAATSGPAVPAPISLPVTVTVTYVPTSGACAAQQAQSGFQVVCGRPVMVSAGGGLGSYSRMFPNAHGTGGMPAAGAAAPAGDSADPGSSEAGSSEAGEAEAGEEGEVVRRGLRRSDGPHGNTAAEITSWRLVSLHNGAYVELTIAW